VNRFHGLGDLLDFFISVIIISMIISIINHDHFNVSSWYRVVQHFQIAHLRSSEDQVLAIAGFNVDGALSVQLKQGTDFATMNPMTGCFNHNSATNELDWDWGLDLDWDWGWDLDWDWDWDWDWGWDWGLDLGLDLGLDWDWDWDWDGLLHNVCHFVLPYLQMGALNGNATALYLVSVRVLVLLLHVDNHCSS
jgi:hypothetical protein